MCDKFAVESAIENAHRTGKAESGRPRPIIASFNCRFTRRAVMWETLHNTNIRFLDNLTKTDPERKNRLKRFFGRTKKERSHVLYKGACTGKIPFLHRVKWLFS